MFLTVQKAIRSARFGEGVEVLRIPQAVACRKRCVEEPRKPRGTPDMRTALERDTAIEAMMGKPGNRTRLDSAPVRENHDPGGWENPVKGRTCYMSTGCLIEHSTQSTGKPCTLGKDSTELRSPQRKPVLGTVGPGKDEPTSLRGIANRAKARKQHRFKDLYRELNVDLLRHCWGDLNKNAASGVDGVTAAVYQENLEANLQDLAERLKTKRYRTKLVRRCYIPKENGKERPLGIPALEDKLVQLACANPSLTGMAAKSLIFSRRKKMLPSKSWT
jgi:hypothetical protein